ncbi:hypothetical protein GLOIN_2v1772675 [Rhizophagus irregularis DAOM 181602=DAOM 197198]|uniref:Uncharacterized protein n=1 Tax=Rhizophagus irregularis (strain DAOM 181602 / DAOM 197198 / MUCL 43194) TaxID=747089 RepID=U9UBR1_RHIID|nr:hypothetical protein RhiirB3_453174 [Rhizophagus irregularis]GBC36294.1 hypothetical protein GLOIN_2v1772675 [Rhizophagus irregularis DAOM 181602=DAOM 197198]
MNVFKSVTNNVVYNTKNPTLSMLLQLNGTLAFKIIHQDCGRVWTRYLSLTLNQPKNKLLKKTDSTQK